MMWNRSLWLHVLYRQQTPYLRHVPVQEERHWKHIQISLKTVGRYYKHLQRVWTNPLPFRQGREVRIMVVPEQVSDADMVLLARDISKQIEAELEYPGQIKVSVIRESRAVDYAK